MTDNIPEVYKTMFEKIEDIPDSSVRNRLSEAVREEFNFEKTESTKELLKLYGIVFELLMNDIISPKKSEAFAKLLSGAGNCKKDFLNIEFPDDVLKQCNEVMERWKAGIISALKHLLSEDDFGNVMKEIGTQLGWKT